LQRSQIALEWSQKSRTTWINRCRAAAPGKARRDATPSKRCRARRNSELFPAGGRLAGLEVLDAERWFGDKATMERVVLKGFAEKKTSIS
jgi:hypothetical protein